MSQNAIQPPVLSLQGRFNRLTFLGWNCLLLITNLLMGLIFISFMPNTIDAIFRNANSFIVQAVFIIPNIIFFTFILLFSIKRLHDINLTAWLAFLELIPFVNLLFFIFLVCMPGTEGDNKYGIPRATQTWESVLAVIFILLLVIILVLFSNALLGILSLSL
ncbi:DUF805 domain-containing protein [Acinetobacter sp. Marseille-Q1618]|uniref:DUF805 domain-containing protein n=1 Tax=Acinetobacter sp. Marseille-Q1618 TaxID=2697502 RepID=UPI00156F8D8F|nr:DUF805 domain-containing protein [Acinetobacter sp. Marseille-Q1618]